MLIISVVKKLFVFISSLITYSFLALPAFAQTQSLNPCEGAQGITAALCSLGLNTSQTIRNIVVFFVVLAVIIALLYLLYGGIKWITSRGEKAEVEAARNHIMAAILGLIVVFLAIFLVTVILAAFGIKLDQLQIPTITGN